MKDPIPPLSDHRLEAWLAALVKEFNRIKQIVEPTAGDDGLPGFDGTPGAVNALNHQFITAEAGDLTDQSEDLTGVVGETATAVCVFARGKTNDGADIVLGVKQNSGASYQPLLHHGFFEANGGQATSCSSTWVALDSLSFMFDLATTGTAVTDAWVVAWA
jgi:hypothetical protein